MRAGMQGMPMQMGQNADDEDAGSHWGHVHAKVRLARGAVLSEHEGGSQVGCGHALPTIALI